MLRRIINFFTQNNTNTVAVNNLPPDNVQPSNSATMPPKPDGWQSEESWQKYQLLLAKYPAKFNKYTEYINLFTPVELEMIMKYVGEAYFFDELTLKHSLLFEYIGKTKQKLLEYNAPYTLEYVIITHSTETYPSTDYFAYKFIGLDTIYNC